MRAFFEKIKSNFNSFINFALRRPNISSYSQEITANLNSLTASTKSSSVDAEILDQSLPPRRTGNDHISTSLTLDYERSSWGVERVCLDGIQNHMPSDAKGTQMWPQCYVNNRWVSLEEARENREQIKAVRFVDDGVGFDAQNLALFWSGKKDDGEARGQFGEGMKMISAAAARENLGMVLESQNWRAIPQGKVVKMNNTRTGEAPEVEQLVFDVEYFPQEASLKGSRTIFLTPSSAFIDEVLQLDRNVLDLQPDYTPAFSDSNDNQIVHLGLGPLYVKGIKVSEENTVFSYNLRDVETNRDRNRIVGTNVADNIAQILSQVDDPEIIKKLLIESQNNPKALEFKSASLQSDHPEVWRIAFEEVFGESAVLDTGYNPPKKAAMPEVTKISLPANITNQLKKARVRTDQDSAPESYTETITTSVTLSYGDGNWGHERICLDTAQNHLSRDSGGNYTALRFQTKDGKWMDIDLLRNYYKDEDIQALKISDNGNGYDYRLLGLFLSLKGESDTAGKFGEGLKMLSAAALRNGIDISLHSRGWRAVPRTTELMIEGQRVQQLVFDVTHSIKDGATSDNDVCSWFKQVSSTTFHNPTPDFIQEFLKIKDKVLELSNKRPLQEAPSGDLLSVDAKQLFVKGILIPDEAPLKYSYNFKEHDIKVRDRHAVSVRDIKAELAKIWSEIDNPYAVKDFIYQAALAAENNSETLEFQIDFSPKDEAQWVQASKKAYGERTAICDVRKQSGGTVAENAHVGLRTLALPTTVYQMLSRCKDGDDKILTYDEVLGEMNKIEIIPDESLTQQERAVLHFLEHEVYPFITRSDKTQKAVAYEPRGKEVANGLSGHPVKLNRCILQDLRLSVDIFIHECAHNISGASDADAGFRNCLTRLFAGVALENLGKPKSVLEVDLTGIDALLENAPVAAAVLEDPEITLQ